jgi:hypothetical protein
VGLRFWKNHSVYKAVKYFETDIGLELYAKFLQLPFVEDRKKLKLVRQLQKAIEMNADLNEMVIHIKHNSWFFDSPKLLELSNAMSAQDKKDFMFDPNDIDIGLSGIQFMSGLHRYYIKEDVPSIESGLK